MHVAQPSVIQDAAAEAREPGGAIQVEIDPIGCYYRRQAVLPKNEVRMSDCKAEWPAGLAG
jgi:hypothetical protein